MKERILQIMQIKQMSQKIFAETLGIAPSSLSSLLSGRTAPTNNHVQAIHRCFPEISITWLMFGEGDMIKEEQTESAPTPQLGEMGDLFSAPQELPRPVVTPAPGPQIDAHALALEIAKNIDKPQRHITEIHVYYDDGTFEKFGEMRD